MAQGRGVPAELRLLVEALAWAPAAARRGILAAVALTVRDLVRAIWPNGWRRNENLPKLVRGIDRISAFGVLSDGRFRWRPLWFQLSPDLAAGLDDPMRLHLHRRKSDDAPVPLPGFSPAARRLLIFGPDETAGNVSTLRSRRAAAAQRGRRSDVVDGAT